MTDENKLVVTESTELIPVDQTKENRAALKQQSQEILTQLVKATNPEKEKELTNLFNSTHNKKAMIRQDDYDEVQDVLVTTLKKRVMEHPDHFTDEELVKAIVAINGVMEKNSANVKQNVEEQLIQINNPVTVNAVQTETMSKASRDNVSNFIKDLMSKAGQTVTVLPEETKND